MLGAAPCRALGPNAVQRVDEQEEEQCVGSWARANTSPVVATKASTAATAVSTFQPNTSSPHSAAHSAEPTAAAPGAANEEACLHWHTAECFSAHARHAA